MKYFLNYDETTLACNGFYVEGIHKNIPSPSIEVDEELWKNLTMLNSFKFVEKPSLDFLTIDDLNLFKQVDLEVPPVDNTPTINERVLTLEKDNADMLLTTVSNEMEINTVKQDFADLLLQIGNTTPTTEV